MGLWPRKTMWGLVEDRSLALFGQYKERLKIGLRRPLKDNDIWHIATCVYSQETFEGNLMLGGENDAWIGKFLYEVITSLVISKYQRRPMIYLYLISSSKAIHMI